MILYRIAFSSSQVIPWNLVNKFFFIEFFFFFSFFLMPQKIMEYLSNLNHPVYLCISISERNPISLRERLTVMIFHNIMGIHPPSFFVAFSVCRWVSVRDGIFRSICTVKIFILDCWSNLYLFQYFGSLVVMRQISFKVIKKASFISSCQCIVKRICFWGQFTNLTGFGGPLWIQNRVCGWKLKITREYFFHSIK